MDYLSIILCLLPTASFHVLGAAAGAADGAAAGAAAGSASGFAASLDGVPPPGNTFLKTFDMIFGGSLPVTRLHRNEYVCILRVVVSILNSYGSKHVHYHST